MVVAFLSDLFSDEFNFLWSEIQDHIAEADADLTPVPGQLEPHGRCRYGVLLSSCFGLFSCPLGHFVAGFFQSSLRIAGAGFSMGTPEMTLLHADHFCVQTWP